MGLRLLLTVAVFMVSGVNCMNLTSSIEELDKYKRGTSALSKVELANAYRIALEGIRDEILKLKNKCKSHVSSGGHGETWTESSQDINPEKIATTIDLYRERLYDLSGDGELGQKLQADSEITANGVVVEKFEELEKKVESQPE
jgi:hypothetical protein